MRDETLVLVDTDIGLTFFIKLSHKYSLSLYTKLLRR